MSLVAAPLGSPAFLPPLVSLLQSSGDQLGTSVNRLASGNRIINAGDDIALLSIAAGLQAQNAGLRQASSNVAQGSSLVQVASGGLAQISALLTAMQAIAQQANTVALTAAQRGFLQEKFSSDFSQIDSIAGATSFNNIKLLDGTLAGGINIQAGTRSTDVITVAIANAGTGAIFSGTPNLATPGAAAAAETAVTNASNAVQTIISHVNGLQDAIDAASASLTQSTGGTTSANSNLVDTDLTAESSNFVHESIQVNAGTAVLAQAYTLPPQLLRLLKPMGHA